MNSDSPSSEALLANALRLGCGLGLPIIYSIAPPLLPLTNSKRRKNTIILGFAGKYPSCQILVRDGQKPLHLPATGLDLPSKPVGSTLFLEIE